MLGNVAGIHGDLPEPAAVTTRGVLVPGGSVHESSNLAMPASRARAYLSGDRRRRSTDGTSTMVAPSEETAVAWTEAVARFVAHWARATGADHRRPGIRPVPAAIPPPDPGRERVQMAARRATVAYPGAVGELLARELLAYLEVGARFGEGSSLLSRLVDDLAEPGRADSPTGVARMLSAVTDGGRSASRRTRPARRRR